MVTAHVYIQGTETDPGASAHRTWAHRAGWLYTECEAKVTLAADPWLAPNRRAEARERLVEFATNDLLGYLRAVDSALYAAAAGAAPTRLLVRGLRAQHDLLTEGVERLDRTDDADDFAAGAYALVGLLRACLHVERAVLAPALAELAGVDLPTLVADLEALLAGATIEPPEQLDVRAVPRGQRHPRIFAAFCRLGPDGSFVLTNNHDPKHLRAEFEATYPGSYRWDYLETGPERWRIRIGRAHRDTAEHDSSERVGPERVGPERVGPERVGPGREALERDDG